jgi:beta-lactamase class A
MTRRELLLAAPATLLGQNGSGLEARVQAVIAKAPGTVSPYAKNLDTQKSYSVRGDERVRTASTIKLPIMVAVFGEVHAGRAKWSDESVLTKEAKVSGSGVLGQEFSDGVKLPLRDLMNLMIVMSDNTATNMVLDRVSADVVNRYMDQFGLKQTRCMRKILGNRNQPSGISEAGMIEENKKFGLGVTTPHEMVTLLEKIEAGEVISSTASKEMIAILKRQRYQEGIARTFAGTPVASKSGSLEALRSDVGIVYSKRGRIALAITVDGMTKPNWTVDNPGHLTISELAGVLVDGLGK